MGEGSGTVLLFGWITFAVRDILSGFRIQTLPSLGARRVSELPPPRSNPNAPSR
jgi:hypothetical protein